MNKQRLAILITAATGAFSTFLPWGYVPFLGSVNGVASKEWNTLFYFSITILICVIGNRSNRLKGIPLYIAIITAILAGIIGVDTISLINGKGLISSNGFGINSNPFKTGAITSVGIGLYLIVLAGFAIPFIAFLVKDKTEEIAE